MFRQQPERNTAARALHSYDQALACPSGSDSRDPALNAR